MSQWGKITLWDAAADGDLAMCKKRMESSFTKVNATDPQGKTALHEASRWGHADVIEFLVENGADLSMQADEGTTALHLAAEYGHTDAIRSLVKLGADVNCVDWNEDTPLMSAAGRKQVDAVKVLLELGADITLKNQQKKGALDLAGNSDVLAALKGPTHVSPTDGY
mmetsp:Transcript_29345/g.73861  ORF Transcript_29345/g.73861 Transcript_29345/m.73861 type:complete len:167 (+) Transcript_29345:87-587(+)